MAIFAFRSNCSKYCAERPSSHSFPWVSVSAVAALATLLFAKIKIDRAARRAVPTIALFYALRQEWKEWSWERRVNESELGRDWRLATRLGSAPSLQNLSEMLRVYEGDLAIPNRMWAQIVQDKQGDLTVNEMAYLPYPDPESRSRWWSGFAIWGAATLSLSLPICGSIDSPLVQEAIRFSLPMTLGEGALFLIRCWRVDKGAREVATASAEAIHHYAGNYQNEVQTLSTNQHVQRILNHPMVPHHLRTLI